MNNYTVMLAKFHLNPLTVTQSTQVEQTDTGENDKRNME